MPEKSGVSKLLWTSNHPVVPRFNNFPYISSPLLSSIIIIMQAAKGIRKLLFALIVSLPALFNIGALLALITFIYAIIGMTLFGHVRHHGALNDQVNFETFARAMQLLFR